MKRRDFLKIAGAAGASAFVPSSLDLMSMYKSANAAVNYTGANVKAPSVMPQVINIYLYGGPSELAGNLTNIVDIENNSQNSYADAFSRFSPNLLVNDTTLDGTTGQITPSGFWYNAGGSDMQFMLDQSYMSVYRTLHKIKDPTRSHRESILMNLKGSVDVNNSGGVGTHVAALLYQNRTLYEGVTALADGTAISNITNLLLPFVSFEGETSAFAPDPDLSLPQTMRSITLSEDFDNPYSRRNDNNQVALDALVYKMETVAYEARYKAVVDAFTERATLDQRVSALKPSSATVSSTTDTSGNTLPTLTDAADIAANTAANSTTPSQLAYPTNNSFTNRIRAAVTLAIENPSSLYITVGGGLGGWDDHNDVPARYPQRMAALMAVLRSAMLHIKYSNGITPGGLSRSTDNIVINVFGDFGRQVNLNGSNGWDHGNNQNLYTFGGSAVRPGGAAALGKVVGKTERVGATGTNNQVTKPLAGSYEFEPMSVASTIYSYFGASNPAVLTADPTLNPGGDPVIDETQPAEAKLF